MLPVSFMFFAAAVSGALISLGVFVFRGGARDADAERKGTRFLLGFGDVLVHWFVWALSPAEAACRRLGIGPDALNAMGLLLGFTAGVLIGAGRVALAGWLVVLGGVADVLDGRIARATQRVSLYGRFIDSTLDRFVEVFVFLGFAFYLRAVPLGPALAAAALGGSLLVSYAHCRGEVLGVTGAVGLMQRAERMVLVSIVCMIDPGLAAAFGWHAGAAIAWMLGFLAVTAFGTAIYRTIWIARKLRGG